MLNLIYVSLIKVLIKKVKVKVKVTESESVVADSL